MNEPEFTQVLWTINYSENKIKPLLTGFDLTIPNFVTSQSVGPHPFPTERHNIP